MTISIAEAARTMAADMSIEQEANIRIGQLAREFGVTLRTLRFYEDKGLLQPERRGTTRLYTERDRARLRLVLLGRKIGFPLRDVKHILELYNSQGVSVQQLRQFLQKSERQMAWLEKQYAEIESAVTELTGLISEIRGQLGCGASHSTQATSHGTAN